MKDAENTANSSLKNIQSNASGAGGVLTKIGNAATSAANAMKSGFGGVATTLAKIGPIGVAVAGAITLIGTAIFGVFNAVGKLTTKLDSIGKSAKSVNMSAEAYLSLQHACARTGIQMENMLNVLGKVDSALVNAADGNKKAREAFYLLGLSWRDLERLSPERRIMRIADAISKLKSEGKSVPKELYDVLGRRGVQELNKIAADENFSKYVAEASALGFTIDEKTVREAEAYRDAVSDTQQKMLATVSALENQLGLTERLKKAWDELSKKIGYANGRVPEVYSDKFIGIGNIAEDVFKNIDASEFSEDQKRKIVRGFFGEFSPYQRGKNLDESFDYAIKNIDWSKISKDLQKALFEVIAEINTPYKFDANDQNTWVQKRKKTPFELLEEEKSTKRSRIEDELDDYNKALKAENDNYERMQSVVNGIIDPNKEIVRLTNKLRTELGDVNAELDQELVKQVRANAETAKRNRLQKELTNLQETSNKSLMSYYSEMLSINGADKGAVDSMLNLINRMQGIEGVKEFIEHNQNLAQLKNTDVGDELNEFERFILLAKAIQKGDIAVFPHGKEDVETAKQITEQFKVMIKQAENVRESIARQNLNNLIDEANLDETVAFTKRVITDPNTSEAEKNDAVEALRTTEKELTLKKLGLAVTEDNVKIYDELLNKLIMAQEEAQKSKTALEFEGKNSATKYELELQDAILQDNNEEIDRLKRINALKQIGVDATEENLDAYKDQLDVMLQLERKNKNLNFKTTMENQAESTRISLLEKTGQGRRATYEKMFNQMSGKNISTLNAEQIKATFTEDQHRQLKQLSDLMYEVQNIALPTKNEDIIHSNELAAKGGFASSVTIERRDNTERILNIINKINEREEDIRVIIRDIHNNKL